MLGEGSEAQGLKTESVESVAGGQQGAGQALAELQAGSRGYLQQEGSLLPAAPGDASGRVCRWGLTSGRCGTEELCSFLQERGAGSQVLSSWPVWEGDGTCCPSCSREG